MPDISTVDAFKQSLLAARAIAYTDPASGGTAGIYLAKLFEKMGIAAELKPKSVLVKGGLAAEKLMSGEAEIAMQPASELLAVPGVVLVGPIPLEVQTYIIYAGARQRGRARPGRCRRAARRPARAGQGGAAEEEGDGAALATCHPERSEGPLIGITKVPRYARALAGQTNLVQALSSFTASVHAPIVWSMSARSWARLT